MKTIISYKDIEATNKTLKTVPIKGKEYIPVNERIKAFRKHYPEGRIETELITYIPDDYAVVRCSVYADDSDKAVAQGMAQETVTKNSNINRTSMLENAETSAVGRALGFLGIGSSDSIASADEMNKAINKGKELDELIGPELAGELVRELMDAGQSPDAVVRYNKVEDMAHLTFEQYQNVKKRYLKK